MKKDIFDKSNQDNRKFLDAIYQSCYSYVTGVLIYKKGCQKTDAEDIFIDAVLKFQQSWRDGKLRPDVNVKAYVSRIAVNMMLERYKKRKTELEKAERFIINQQRVKDNESFDKMVKKEDEENDNAVETIKVKAVRWAMGKLGKVCRELLKDSIVQGLKPRDLAGKYGFKNARVLTDKKSKCKKKFREYVKERIIYLRTNPD